MEKEKKVKKGKEESTRGEREGKRGGGRIGKEDGREERRASIGGYLDPLARRSHPKSSLLTGSRWGAAEAVTVAPLRWLTEGERGGDEWGGT